VGHQYQVKLSGVARLYNRNSGRLINTPLNAYHLQHGSIPHFLYAFGNEPIFSFDPQIELGILPFTRTDY